MNTASDRIEPVENVQNNTISALKDAVDDTMNHDVDDSGHVSHSKP